MLLKKRWTWPLILGILMIAPAIAKPVSTDSITWLSYEKAQQVRTDRKFFVYFNADWCGFCRKLEATTFKDPEIIAYINSNFTPVKVDIDREKQIAAQNGVTGVPDLHFFSSKGEPIGHQSGFMESEQLMPLLEYIHTDSYLTQDWTQFLKEHS